MSRLPWLTHSRNLGIVFAFMVFFCATYLLATENISEAKSKGEILLLRRGHTLTAITKRSTDKEKSSDGPGDLKPVQSTKHEEASAVAQRQIAAFHWKDVCYDISIRGDDKRILDHVDGWVKPGTCTALMVIFKARLNSDLATDDLHRVFLVPGKLHSWTCSQPEST